MVNGSGVFSLRLNEDERRVLDALAKQLERKPGDAMRVIMRRAAHDLGVKVSTQQTDQAQQRAT